MCFFFLKMLLNSYLFQLVKLAAKSEILKNDFPMIPTIANHIIEIIMVEPKRLKPKRPINGSINRTKHIKENRVVIRKKPKQVRYYGVRIGISPII